jgi:hypothetical protein
MRADGPRRQLFICNVDKTQPREAAQIRLRGAWQVTLLDTMTGTQRPLPAKVEGGWTTLGWDFPAHGHLLITMAPAGEGSSAQQVASAPEKRHRTESALKAERVPVTLSEPNVLVLDQAPGRLLDERVAARGKSLRVC